MKTIAYNKCVSFQIRHTKIYDNHLYFFLCLLLFFFSIFRYVIKHTYVSYGLLVLPQKVKTQYAHLYSITDTSVKLTISLQSTPMPKSCTYTCLIKYLMTLVMKEHWSSAHFFMISPREKEVACNKSAMHILLFYFVGQC